MEKAQGEKAHIAIEVHNLNAACEVLRSKGVELEEPKTMGNAKLAYLKGRDPAGYRVHVISRY